LLNYRQRCYGFTLVELLVVIGIIAILASIVFAVTMRAKASALQTRCLSNVRQLAQATLMYASENSGVLPPFVNLKPKSSVSDSVTQDINPGTGIQNAEALHTALNSYVKNKSIWFCPTDIFAGKDIGIYMINHEYSSYNFNFSKSLTLTDSGYVSPYTDNTYGHYTSPSNYRLIMDSNFSYCFAKDRPIGSIGYNPGGCEHFDGGINCAYLDGHAVFLKTP